MSINNKDALVRALPSSGLRVEDALSRLTELLANDAEKPRGILLVAFEGGNYEVRLRAYGTVSNADLTYAAALAAQWACEKGEPA